MSDVPVWIGLILAVGYIVYKETSRAAQKRTSKFWENVVKTVVSAGIFGAVDQVLGVISGRNRHEDTMDRETVWYCGAPGCRGHHGPAEPLIPGMGAPMAYPMGENDLMAFNRMMGGTTRPSPYEDEDDEEEDVEVPAKKETKETKESKETKEDCKCRGCERKKLPVETLQTETTSAKSLLDDDLPVEPNDTD